MIMRKTSRVFTLSAAFFAVLLTMTSCSDFFNPGTDDELPGDEFISSNTEMYTGFIGLMTKLQAVGDKEILLTDTRGEFLEPTKGSSPELYALYNYNTDLEGNSYANPAPYYELVIACNDYISKLREYRDHPQVDEDIYANLMSSTIRLKVWTYKTIGEIYGKAAWINDAITKVSVLSEPGAYKLMEMPEVVDSCLDLLDKGIDGISSNRVIDWIGWIDPDNINSAANSAYRKWNLSIPPYEALYAELCLWKGAVIDAQGADATVWYQKAADTCFNGLDNYVNCKYNGGSDPGSTVYWLPSAATPGAYPKIWLQQDPSYQEGVSCILYDYSNNQTNTLVRHFCSDYPAQFLLCPSEVGMTRFTDTSLNPGGGESEGRYKYLVGNTNGEKYVAKYRTNGGRNGVRANAYEDDVQIYTYRATQYHMMLCEALNHLQRFKAMDVVLNTGIANFINNILDATVERQQTTEGELLFNETEHAQNIREWTGFTRNWTASAEWGTRKYPFAGIRGCYNLSNRKVVTEPSAATVASAIRTNDLAILDEILLEFACEGKTYPAMNRMALRYNDLSIVANRVCAKYDEAKAAIVRSRIMEGGNYVPYDLKLK